MPRRPYAPRAAAIAFSISSIGSAPDRIRSPTTQLGVPFMPSFAAVCMFLAISASTVATSIAASDTPDFAAAPLIEASLTGPPA